MRRRIVVTVSAGVFLAVVLLVVLWLRKTSEADRFGDFDWNAIKAMIASGAASNERCSITEVELHRVQIPSAKVFFVVDRIFGALLGPKQAVFVYYPEDKALIYDRKRLRAILETLQYEAESPEELLQLASEVAPLLYGSHPAQHEIVTESDLVGSGRLPITKNTIPMGGKHAKLSVNYYAKLSPWGDIVNVTAVLQAQRLRVSIRPVYQVPRVYE